MLPQLYRLFTELLTAFGSVVSRGPSKQVTNIKQKKTITVTVEGNIASGKTTFLENFTNIPYIKVYSEPVEKWRDISGENALQHMYKDPRRYGISLQTYVQLTMLKIHSCDQQEPIKLMERSIDSARYCFVENLWRSNTMCQLDYNVLCAWYDWIKRNDDTDVDLIIYLKSEPEKLHDRIISRSRKEEQNIPIELLQKLDLCHDDWLINKKFGPVPPVIIIDAHQKIEDMKREALIIKEQIASMTELDLCTSSNNS